jgi:hypothetical protein
LNTQDLGPEVVERIWLIAKMRGMTNAGKAFGISKVALIRMFRAAGLLHHQEPRWDGLRLQAAVKKSGLGLGEVVCLMARILRTFPPEEMHRLAKEEFDSLQGSDKIRWVREIARAQREQARYWRGRCWRCGELMSQKSSISSTASSSTSTTGGMEEDILDQARRESERWRTKPLRKQWLGKAQDWLRTE